MYNERRRGPRTEPGEVPAVDGVDVSLVHDT